MMLKWLGDYSFVLEVAGKTVVIDPCSGDESEYPVADVIIITQWHFAHCNVGFVRKCMGDETIVLGTEEVASQIFPCSTFKTGDSRRVDDIEIFCMPVNNPRPGIKPGSKPSAQFGFVLHAEGKKHYFIGDSDFVEGMQDVLPDTLIIPVGGTVTLNPKQAADTARLISPKVAVPVMWGGFVGSKDDADYFAELCRDADVDVLVPELGSVLPL